jgi:hypothetical protein
MVKLAAPFIALLIASLAGPVQASEVSQREMIDHTCTVYRDGMSARPKMTFMKSSDRARLAAEEHMLTLVRMIHSDTNTYYKSMSNNRREAPVLELYRTSRRIGNKGCTPGKPQ